jgi:hypothetical protein
MSISSLKHNAHVINFPLKWSIYFFLSERGVNLITDWLDAEKISVKQRADFQAKIDLFERGGSDLITGFITDTPIAPDIYKMKIKGQVQLRPMVCRGPLDLGREYTVLVGWIERDNARVPNNIKKKASENRSIIIADPRRRRRERIG